MTNELEGYLFRCALCDAEEVFEERELPDGDPEELDRNCDHCNSPLVYVKENTEDNKDNNTYAINSVPQVVRDAIDAGAETCDDVRKFIKNKIHGK